MRDVCDIVHQPQLGSSSKPQAHTMLLDLRDRSGCGLNPLARVLVYAVMLHPRDQRARNRVLATATAKHLTAKKEAKAMAEAHSAARAGLAGDILLRLVLLDEAGLAARLNAASFLIGTTWPDDWQTDPELPRLRGLKTGRQRERHLKAWHQYRPAAHLWAAFLLSQIRTPERPVFSDQESHFLEFLHTADWFAVRGSKILLYDQQWRRRLPAMKKSKVWRFNLPQHIAPNAEWNPDLPLITEEELKAYAIFKCAS